MQNLSDVYLGVIWVVAVALTGYAFGRFQPRESWRGKLLFTSSACFALLGNDLVPFQPAPALYQMCVFAAVWLATAMWLLFWTRPGRDAMESRVPKDIALLRSLG